MEIPSGSAPEAERESLKLGPAVRLLLWDYTRGSLAYDLAFVLVVLLVLLIPGASWDDPLWPR
jgi:hypothetical protein